jgi:hypothetical protein
VPKIKPQPDAKASPEPKAKPRSKKRAAAASTDEPARSRHPLARRRALTAAVLAVVGLLTLGSRAVWRAVAPSVAARDRYVLHADRVLASAPPEWITADVRRQVVDASGLAGRLSLLDPKFHTTVEHAFTLHPWVASVTRIEKRYPSGVHVDLSYRQPIAVIESPQAGAAELLPIDARGVHLPAGDVPLIRRTYLPRIIGVAGQPPTGQAWDDPRVPGAVELAVRLAGLWEELDLTTIVPSAREKVEVDRNYFTYDLINRAGTRIEWGPAPHAAPPGEDDFDKKLTRLKACIAERAALDLFDWPEKINIRRGIDVTPRQAKKPRTASDPVVAAKPEETSAEPEPVVK